MKLRCEYDFGDNSLHQISLEKATQSEPKVKYPRCREGSQACPPEDVGGVYGFIHFVDVITVPAAAVIAAINQGNRAISRFETPYRTPLAAVA